MKSHPWTAETNKFADERLHDNFYCDQKSLKVNKDRLWFRIWTAETNRACGLLLKIVYFLGARWLKTPKVEKTGIVARKAILTNHFPSGFKGWSKTFLGDFFISNESLENELSSKKRIKEIHWETKKFWSSKVESININNSWVLRFCSN